MAEEKKTTTAKAPAKTVRRVRKTAQKNTWTDLRNAQTSFLRSCTSVRTSMKPNCMLPYREQIDKTVNRLLLYDKRARKADKMFYERLAGLQRKIDDLCEPIKSGNHYAIDPQNITLIQELEEDYKRRQGNIVLRAVKDIKPEIFERKFRRKVNDNSLKRKLAISHYKVGKLIGSFLSSFGEESEYLSRDYTDRLKEIEDEMEAEREQNKEQERMKNSRWNFEKG